MVVDSIGKKVCGGISKFYRRSCIGKIERETTVYTVFVPLGVSPVYY